MAVIHEEENLLGSWSSVEEPKKENVQTLDSNIPFIDNSILSKDTNIPVLKISEKQTELTKTEWAEQLDVSAPVTDFDKKILVWVKRYPSIADVPKDVTYVLHFYMI